MMMESQNFGRTRDKIRKESMRKGIITTPEMIVISNRKQHALSVARSIEGSVIWEPMYTYLSLL